MDKLLLASILYDENDKDSAYGPTPLVTDVCKFRVRVPTCVSSYHGPRYQVNNIVFSKPPIVKWRAM